MGLVRRENSGSALWFHLSDFSSNIIFIMKGYCFPVEWKTTTCILLDRQESQQRHGRFYFSFFFSVIAWVMWYLRHAEVLCSSRAAQFTGMLLSKIFGTCDSSFHNSFSGWIRCVPLLQKVISKAALYHVPCR